MTKTYIKVPIVIDGKYCVVGNCPGLQAKSGKCSNFKNFYGESTDLDLNVGGYPDCKFIRTQACLDSEIKTPENDNLSYDREAFDIRSRI